MAVCAINGNTDMYGIGIRIGFYLQWYGAIFASWLAPSELKTLRFTITLYIAATFAALIVQVARDVGSLDVVEVYIILLLTFGYFLFLIPLYIWRLLTRCDPRFDPTRYPRVHAGPVYSQLTFSLSVAVATFQLWFWFARVPALSQRNCQEYGFFFAKIRLNAKTFTTVNIVFYLLLLVSCIIILLITLGKRMGLFEEVERPELPTDHIDALQRLQSVFNVAVASTVLAATELTIRWNKIGDINTLSSAGQTIPFLIGVGALARILFVYHYESSPSDDDQSYRIPGPAPATNVPFRAQPQRPRRVQPAYRLAIGYRVPRELRSESMDGSRDSN